MLQFYTFPGLRKKILIQQLRGRVEHEQKNQKNHCIWFISLLDRHGCMYYCTDQNRVIMMSKKINIETSEIDSQSITCGQRIFYSLGANVCNIALFAVKLLLRSIHNDYPKKYLKRFLSLNNNYIFDQRSYVIYESFFKRIIMPFRDKTKIVFANNVAFVIEKIDHDASAKKVKNAFDRLNQSTYELQQNNQMYQNSNHFVVQLKATKDIKIHKIIIQKFKKGDDTSCATSDYIKEKEGIIHLFSEEDFNFTVYKLLTPSEFDAYLRFREWFFLNNTNKNKCSERELIGQYLMKEQEALPDLQYAQIAENDDIKSDIWEIMLSSLHQSTIGQSERFEKQHCYIVSMIARLKRSELILLRDTFENHLNNIKSSHHSKSEINILLPFGFIFIEHRHISREQVAEHYNIAINAYCYERRLTSCVVVLLLPSNNELGCDIKWEAVLHEHLVDE